MSDLVLTPAERRFLEALDTLGVRYAAQIPLLEAALAARGAGAEPGT